MTIHTYIQFLLSGALPVFQNLSYKLQRKLSNVLFIYQKKYSKVTQNVFFAIGGVRDQGEDTPKQAGSCWFARQCRLALSGANLNPPGVWFADAMSSFFGVTYVLFFRATAKRGYTLRFLGQSRVKPETKTTRPQ